MPPDNALIHLNVPASTKARWVRESRALGMRLTDWIVQRVETSIMQPAAPRVAIPDGLEFADLQLARAANGDISFSPAVIERIELASGLPVGWFASQPEDALSALLTHWYRLHIAAGGSPDSVQEDLIAEARLEDERGHGLSHQPGRA